MTVARQGENAVGLLVVKSGRVQLFHLSTGGKSRTFKLVGPANIIGLTEAISGGAYQLSAVTADFSEIEFVPRGSSSP